jgi:protein-S-isoprenylcysteine O-methyltransferase Ste14
MNRELAVRAFALYAPVAAAGARWWWRQLASPRPRVEARRAGASVLLACAWNAPTLFVVHLFAMRAGWWTFHASSGLFAGVPVDLYLGWIVLWGAVPPLAFRSMPVPLVAAAMVCLDLLLMPLCDPVVSLGPSWLIGEAVAVAIVLMPSQYLARWTAMDRHLEWRAVLQAIAFGGLLLLVIPAAIIEQAGGSWRPLIDRSPRWNSLLAQLLAIPAVLGISAVQEFVVRGRGTPIPYDPPRRLVTTGPYAYIANPMQVAAALVVLMWAAMLDNLWLVGASLTAIAYGAGLAGWHEHEDLIARFGKPWIAYRREVQPWWPRWQPFMAGTHSPGRTAHPARLYVAQTCGTCRPIGQWLAKRGVIGLEIVPAEAHPTRDLVRLTYEPSGEGPADEGVAAFGRALEHINFGWAFLGMFIRLPVVRPFLQLLADAGGGHPRCIPRDLRVRPSPK